MHVSFDWQALAVALIVLTALVYAGRRAFARLRSFTSRGRAGVADCATGCGKCSDEVKDSKPANALVQISSESASRQRKILKTATNKPRSGDR